LLYLYMKPFRTFIFFAAVLLLISLVALLIPEEGIEIGGHQRLSFISLSDLVSNDTLAREGVVEQLVAGSQLNDDPESDQGTDLLMMLEDEEESSDPQVIPVNTDSLKQQLYRIQFPEGGKAALHAFFERLNRISSGQTRQTRILHFGDSQIENNRMTALIRYRLQKHFGGSGTGLVQAIPLYSRSLSYDQEQTGNWLRYTYFGNRDSTITHKSYGIMGAFASVPLPVEGEWPSLYYRFHMERRSGQVSRIRIFMHSYVDSARVAFQINDGFFDTLSYLPDGLSVADHRHHERIRDLRLSFDLPQGGRIYGISFESGAGLQVDNIAMRGGSGLIFTSMDRGTEKAMLNVLSPGLVLLQYGGNVVPYMNARYYQRAFKRQLQFFKASCPGIPVIVIGPSDMSVRENGVFVTYPGLEKIRDALKTAALESGYGFWDLYEAMGGYNSMASFVHADPPLASTDYVHFTGTGINLVSEMFYNALMLEYEEFENQKKAQ